MSKPFAWSYSALNDFETCPKRFFLTRISKQVKEKQTSATLYGNQVHQAMEMRVKMGSKLPTGMDQWEPMAVSLDKARENGAIVTTEQKMAISKDLRPVAYFAKDVWCRSIADVSVEKKDKVSVLDWKTGRPTPASTQLMLSAAFFFHHKPYVNTVTTSFIWLKEPDHPPTQETYHREQLPRIWNEFNPRVERVTHAIENDKFPPQPSGLCRSWCPVGKALCDHCGE